MQYPEGIDRTLPLEATVTGIGLRPLPSGRHQRVLPAPLVTRNLSEIKIRSDQLTSRIVLELFDGKHYIQHPEGHLAEYRQILPRGKGYVGLVVSHRSDESWEQVLASLDLLGDELVDTFLVLIAVALDTNGTERITLPFAISPDDILAICQKKKSKGSYPATEAQSVFSFTKSSSARTLAT